jgi:integrase
VPERLPRLPVANALATVELPLHLDWSSPDRTVDLGDRRQHARCYEVVLREGTPTDIDTYVDGALLVDVWDDLVLPADIRRAWRDVIATIDRRLSTVCGFYRFAHIDGRIGSNPAEYVRRAQVHPSDARGLDRSELDMFLAAADHYDFAHQALAVLLGLNDLRVSEACETNVEGLAVERGHRILRITGKNNKRRRGLRSRRLIGAEPQPVNRR